MVFRGINRIEKYIMITTSCNLKVSAAWRRYLKQPYSNANQDIHHLDLSFFHHFMGQIAKFSMDHLRELFDFWSHSLRYEKIFANVIKIISDGFSSKFSPFRRVEGDFHDTPSGRWFPWHIKGGVPSPINTEVFFSDILATESWLNTLYGF